MKYLSFLKHIVVFENCLVHFMQIGVTEIFNTLNERKNLSLFILKNYKFFSILIIFLIKFIKKLLNIVVIFILIKPKFI